MKKSKKWLSLISTGMFLFTLSGCVLARGTYTGEEKQVNGFSIKSGQHSGEFVYEINTEDSSQIFSRLNISITESRIVYKFGKYDIKILITVSNSRDFINGITVSQNVEVGKSELNSLQLSFSEKTEELEALNANKLYVKIEIVTDENDEDFDPSWAVLGNIKISGGEKLKGANEEEENVYLFYDFSNLNDFDSTVVEKENVTILNDKLIPESLGQASYVIYKMEPNNKTNSFEVLKLKIENSMLKSKTGEKIGENGLPELDEDENVLIEEKGKTKIVAYVSNDKNYFAGDGVSLSSSIEGVTSGEIDLSASVSNITSSTIYVKIEMQKDEGIELDNPSEYLNIGKISFIGEESKKNDSYLDKDLTKESQEYIDANNVYSYIEKAEQEQLKLNKNGKCEYLRYIYNEDGTYEIKKSNVCTWREKGVTYNRNIVAGLTSAQLKKAISNLSLRASSDDDIEYEGRINLGSYSNIPIFVKQVADEYYELSFDLETYTEGESSVKDDLSNLAKKKAYEFSNKVFLDYSAEGEGNVIHVDADGVRELYVHTGKLLLRASDLERFKR